MAVLVILMPIFPKKYINPPTPLVVTYYPVFFIIIIVAVIADSQKLSPINANCVYAFSSKNSTMPAKHSATHLAHAIATFAESLFWPFFSASSRALTMTLSMNTKASKKEPRDSEPKL